MDKESVKQLVLLSWVSSFTLVLIVVTIIRDVNDSALIVFGRASILFAFIFVLFALLDSFFERHCEQLKNKKYTIWDK